MPAEYIYNSVTSLIAGNVGMNATDLTVQITDDTLFAPLVLPTRIIIDQEIMMLTLDVAGLLTVTRGLEGSVPAVHAAGAAVSTTVTAGGLYAVFLAI